MTRRLIGLLLILRALSPFIWLLAAFLVASAIGGSFDRVSVRYAAQLEVQFDAYDKLAVRVAEQVEAIEPAVRRAVQETAREIDATLDQLAATVAQIKALPAIDLSNVVPELRFPAIRIPDVVLNWKVPNVPIVREVVNGIKSAVQGMANGVNTAFAQLGKAIGTAFDKALAPLRNELVANVMRQLGPYLDAYGRVSASLALIGRTYDGLAAKVADLQRQVAATAAAWQAIGDELGRQIGLSVSLVETVPAGLGTALGESVTLLVFFFLFTLALFLVFYWAGMTRDLLQGWLLLTGKHEAWKRRANEPRPRAVDRWLETLDRKEAAGAANNKEQNG